MKFPKASNVEVQLVKVESNGLAGAAYHEVSKGDEHFVVAIPGQVFQVRVTAPPSLFLQSENVQVRSFLPFLPSSLMPAHHCNVVVYSFVKDIFKP